ncbi:MAG: hypothetical protein GTO63_12595 [Anaerolineae bacterium]|nr:hypothetical protein [Anaerolineae bacterium]NIN95731.1 hypothetical protein [Anaerolineae bacterium]
MQSMTIPELAELAERIVKHMREVKKDQTGAELAEALDVPMWQIDMAWVLAVALAKEGLA